MPGGGGGGGGGGEMLVIIASVNAKEYPLEFVMFVNKSSHTVSKEIERSMKWTVNL